MGPNVSLSSLKAVESDLLYVNDMLRINEDAVDIDRWRRYAEMIAIISHHLKNKCT
jgi:hypothetical protein